MNKAKRKLVELFLLLLVVTSVYHPCFNGRRMANGSCYQHYNKYTAASVKYPIGTKLRVEYGRNHVDVEVTDKIGRKNKNRLDLSGLAMRHLVGSWCGKKGDDGCTLIKTRVRVMKVVKKKNK